MGRYDGQSTQVLQMDWSDCENHVCVHGCVPGFHGVFGVSLRCKNVSRVKAKTLLIVNRGSGTLGESVEAILLWNFRGECVVAWDGGMGCTYVGGIPFKMSNQTRHWSIVII
jgi:hypothetical protein